MFLRNYMFEFMELFAPHLSREMVKNAIRLRDKREIIELFKEINLPVL